MRFHNRWILLLAALVLALLFSPALAAQEARGTIVGRVLDTSNAVIPNAAVEVTNKAMGTKLPLVTNEVGFYQATYLIPGLYQIAVEVPGFRKVIRDNVEVRVNDRIEINVTLEVGTAEQTLTVTAETPLLDTASASMGSVVSRLGDLPSAHGNPYTLIGLASGVSFARDPRLDRPFEPTHIVGYTMDGTRANRSDVTIDGAPSTATANAFEVIATYVPPPDIVAEFKVQTATFDASFGQTEGGVTNISIKSGTNQLHGAAYYTKMAPGWFANDFFANANRIPPADFSYNRWGGFVGGPVFLPKVYDGRNKTFFLWGYEGIHDARPRNNGTPTVPTEAMKTGDFSSLLALGSSYQIYNPLTRRSVAGGRYQADPFNNNEIPASLINPVARKILGYFPTPLTAGAADGTSNYQRPEMMEGIKYYTHTGRVDHSFSDRNRLFVRGSVYRRDSDYNNYFNNLATGTVFQFVARSAVVDDVYTLNPSTVLNVRYGYNRFTRVSGNNPEAGGFDLTSLGFPAAYNSAIDASVRSFPRIDITGYQGTAGGADLRPIDTHSFSFTAQHTRGSHFLKSGMEFRAYRENSYSLSNEQTGRFNFDATWTRGPFDNSATAPGSLGQSVAALLLGLPSPTNSYVRRASSYAEQSTSWGFFFHDDWKVRSRITLNMGLRWEFEGALTERFDRSVRGFDFAAAQPIEAQARANYAQNQTREVPASQFRVAGGLTFAGVNGLPRALYDTPKRNLMPRFGLAYQLNDKTLLRTGYGIYFGFLGQRRGDVVQSGFTRDTNIIPTLDNINFIGTLSNPFPTGILEPLGASLGAQTYLGQAITVFNQKPLMPYMQRWEFGVQRELSHGFVAEASYVGNRGTHIEINQNLNITPQQYLSHSPVRDNTAIAYLSENLPNPFYQLLPAGGIQQLTGTNIGRERLLRPYPQFDTITGTRYDGYSWYHGLQTRFEKRFSKGYSLAANYTFSKFMQATEVLAEDDPRPTEVISDMDFPHRLTLSGIYELPFGPGRQFLGGASPVLAKIVGGWKLSGIYALQSGAPLNWAMTASGPLLIPQSILFYGNINNVRLSSDQQTVSQWFNPDAGFERAGTRQLDMTRQLRTFPQRFGFLRSDKGKNLDVSVLKGIRIAEGKEAQFRAEFLNALNHPVFPAPNTANASNLTFGSIVASNQANYPRRIQLSLKFVF
jgi:hypothetical protein